MQLVIRELLPVRRCHGQAARSGQRPSLTTKAASTKKRAAAAAGVRCAASRRDDAEFGCGGGRLVDEGMVELRRRIHELRAAEHSWEPPAEWAAWEKEWHGSDDAGDCDLVATLRALLFSGSARPGVGVAIVAALALAVPASAFVLLSHLLDALRALISNLPH